MQNIELQCLVLSKRQAVFWNHVVEDGVDCGDFWHVAIPLLACMMLNYVVQGCSLAGNWREAKGMLLLLFYSFA